MRVHLGIHHSTKALTSIAALWAGLAQAAPPTWLPPVELPEGTILLQVEELKAIYLQCDRLSSMAFLDSSTAANCSQAAEQLRRVGFDGRADAVLAWWKVMSEERRAVVPTSQSVPKARSAALRMEN